MKLLVGWDAAVARWVGDQVGIEDFGASVAIGILRDDDLIAGAVFNNYRHPNIEITFASTTPRWCARGIMAGIFAYPFNQVGCARLTAVTESKNQLARAFLRRLGFQQEGVMRRGFRNGDDAVIYGMLREECRWLELEGLRNVKAWRRHCAAEC